MASSSLAFSSAVSSEFAASSTYRRAMSKQASRHLYNYRLNTPEPQDAYSSTSSSHHRKSTRATQKHSSTHQTALTQNHRASRQLTTAIAPPRRHPGVELPEASASQHQAIYLEYLRLVAAGKIVDPASPPDYQDFGARDGEEVPEFAPPSYEQALKENAVYEDASSGGRRSRGRDEERRRGRGVVFRHQSTQPSQPTQPPAIQELQLIRIATPIPTTLPPRPKSANFFSRLSNKFRASRAG